MQTCDDILNWMKGQAESKTPIDPIRWLEAAEKLNAMIGDETDKLIDLDFELAQIKSFALIQNTGIKAKAEVEANPLFRERQKQKAKIERIQEAIRLAKIHSRLKSEEMRAGL